MRIFVVCLTLLAIAGGHAQGGKNIKPIDPALLEKSKKAGEAQRRGREHVANKQYEEAIAAFREAVAIEETCPGRVSTGHYELAKALTAAGRPSEALAAYKKAIWWDPVRQDLDTNGPPFIRLTMDYAILLAKNGKMVEAKAIYYYGLRQLNRTELWLEPAPLIVVFDPDPTMTVWECTPENLIAAALMVQAPHMGKGAIEAAKEAGRLAPSWSLPRLFLALEADRKKQPALIEEAEALAKTEEERTWIRARAKGESLAPIGMARRKASIVLNQAKLDLAQIHEKVAN